MSQSDPAPGEPSADLFFTPAWFELLRSHGLAQPPHAHEALELPASSGGAPALLPLMQGRRAGGWAALSNYYTGLYGPVGDLTRLTADDWALAARQLRRWPGGGLLSLGPLDAATHWLPQLMQGWARAGYRAWQEPAFGNWYQPVVPGDFAAYWQARPSTLVHTVERARRRLDRAGHWHIDICAPDPGVTPVAEPLLSRLTDAYQHVYAHSWKTPEPNPAFIPALVRLAAAQRCLRLGVLWLHGEPLAAQLWLSYPGRSAQIFKLAHVKGQEKWSAGSVLTAALARHAVDVDGVRELDFLSGDDAYKADWMGFRRERLRLVLAYPGTLVGGLALLRRQVGRVRPGGALTEA